MTYPRQSDIPLVAPSLVNLSASAIARQLPLTQPQTPSTSVSQKENEELNQFCLPLPTSQAIFSALASHWQEFDGRGVSEESLEIFTHGDKFPLEKLNLEESDLSDNLAVRLIAAQQERLRSINLIGCEELTAQLSRSLRNWNVNLPKLETLKLHGMQWFNFWDQNRSKCRPSISLPESHTSSFEDLKRSEGIMSDTESLDDDEKEAFMDLSEESDDTDLWQPFSVFCPGLEWLVLYGNGYEAFEIDPETVTVVLEFLREFLEPLSALRHLNLSYWQQGLDDLRFLRPHSTTLVTLILYDVPDLYKAVDTICEIAALRYLDISQGSRDTGTYPRPVSLLHKLVESLPNLYHLDISSTNLAAQPSGDDWPKKGVPFAAMASDIAGLRPLTRRLKFLGLLNCDNASHYREIPADQIAGDANEDQIILSMKTYISRSSLLQIVLNETYQLYRFGANQNRFTEALHLVLEAMRRHLTDSALQIAGSASLFYIIRQVDMNRSTKRNVVSTLLAGMEAHMEEQVMVRNCCLSLCQFEIPQELLFDYARAARLLVHVLRLENNDHMTQRIVVFLLNSMACHVEGEQKVQVGLLGAIEEILNQIKRKHDSGVCDDVMEVGWSFLWNITDETPVNCERFLDGKGLELFLKCYQLFPHKRKLIRNMMGLLVSETYDTFVIEGMAVFLLSLLYLQYSISWPSALHVANGLNFILLNFFQPNNRFQKFQNEIELVRNMMGLIGNIAEVQYLRYHLMKTEYIEIFCALLQNLTDGIEISYNSAGVLAHICSDGPMAWTVDGIMRDDVMQKIITAASTWQLSARRFINYRSFGPILRLLPLFDSPASQHWAIWALANLTTTDGTKYCSYVVNEGGIPLLNTVMHDFRSTQEVKVLTKKVLENVDKWKRNEIAPAEPDDAMEDDTE